MTNETVKTIKEFFNNKDFNFPKPPTDKCNSVIELYENCIKMTAQPDSSIIEEWHDLLVRYANDPESIKLSRLYESTSNGTEKVYINGIEKKETNMEHQKRYANCNAGWIYLCLCFELFCKAYFFNGLCRLCSRI